jgi:hypothetical protein
MPNENEDPVDEYDRQHGFPEEGPADSHPPMNEAEITGDKLNPVQETPPAFTGLRKV